MGNRLSFLIGNIEFEAELNDSDTANAVWLAAPLLLILTPGAEKFILKYLSKPD